MSSKLNELTEQQAIVITGFTGILAIDDIGLFFKDAAARYGRPIFTHEYPFLFEEIKALYRDDFLAIVHKQNYEKNPIPPLQPERRY